MGCLLHDNNKRHTNLRCLAKTRCQVQWTESFKYQTFDSSGGYSLVMSWRAKNSLMNVESAGEAPRALIYPRPHTSRRKRRARHLHNWSLRLPSADACRSRSVKLLQATKRIAEMPLKRLVAPCGWMTAVTYNLYTALNRCDWTGRTC